MSAVSQRPLWALCTMNDEALPESTPGGFSFDYVDISNVTEGRISDDLERYEFRDAPSRARRLARNGDVIISTVRTYLKAIAQVHSAEEQRVYSTGFAVMRPDAEIADTRYVAYVLSSSQVMDEIVATSVGVSYPAIQGTALHRIRVPYHGVSEQRMIADYLDRETGAIDEMLGKLDELAAKLAARRAAAGSTLHSMGFEPVRLQWLMSEVDDRAENHSQDLPMLSVSIHHGVQLREDSSSNQQASADLGKYKIARPGDIVLNRMRAFQGGVGQARVEGLVSPDYSVLRPHDALTPAWAEYIMRSPQFIEEMTQWLRGIGAADQSNVRTPRINVRDLFVLTIPLPSVPEQQRLTSRLYDITGKLVAMLDKVSALKELLIERRAALITDVVTGRKEVA
jgi:type I restriction enzyme S subunit